MTDFWMNYPFKETRSLKGSVTVLFTHPQVTLNKDKCLVSWSIKTSAD